MQILPVRESQVQKTVLFREWYLSDEKNFTCIIIEITIFIHFHTYEKFEPVEFFNLFQFVRFDVFLFLIKKKALETKSSYLHESLW